MGTVVKIYRQVGRLTDKEDKDFNESIHRHVEQGAYFLAKRDNFSKVKEVYWNAAKAYTSLIVALEEEDPKKPIKRNSGIDHLFRNGHFYPHDNVLPIDEEDTGIVLQATQFSRCAPLYTSFNNDWRLQIAKTLNIWLGD